MLVAASPEDAVERVQTTQIWLQERIRLAYEAQREVGEVVSEAQNARDQIAAFVVHVSKRLAASNRLRLPEDKIPPWDAWLRIPEPDVADRLDQLDQLIVQVTSFVGS